MEIKDKSYHIHFFNNNEKEKNNIKEYFKMEYQRVYLEKIFPKYKSLYNHIKENLDLSKEDPLLIVNLILMYNFISIHDNSLISNLNKPIIYGNTSNYLLTYNNVYLKLNIFNTQQLKSKSLFDYINFTSTIPGKNRLILNLKNPLLNKEVLETKYNQIDELLLNPTNIKTIEDNLQIIDLERIYRRFNIMKLNPFELPKIEQSNIKINNLISFLRNKKGEKEKEVEGEREKEGEKEGKKEGKSKKKNSFTHIQKIIPDKVILDEFKKYCKELEFIFDFSKCSKTNLQDLNINIFNKGFNKNIDALQNEYQNLYNKLQEIAILLVSYIHKPEELKKNKINYDNIISIKYNDKEGHWLDISASRGKKLKMNLIENKFPVLRLKKDIEKTMEIETKCIEFNMQNKSNIKINSHQIKTISQRLTILNNKLISLVKTIYLETIQHLFNTYYFSCIEKINNFITEIDVIKSNAKAAYLYKYCRPKIADNSNSSFIKATNLRHPIIERLLLETGKKYVANNIYLGADESNLIYGVNSVGKSSLLKSVAICIILAQSGLFVPCSECEISIYNKIFTRMGNDDNLYINHSSFVKEMTETREIITKCDENSLVIADELCASTEIDSAIKIVCSIIKILSDKKCSFMFATHLFKITEMPIIKYLKNIKYKHLKVEFKENLIFDRTLTDGLPENKYYGVLVANKIIQENYFLDLMNDNTNFLENKNEIITSKKSKYNSNLFLTDCSICGYKPTITQVPLETHHINMQCDAINKYHGVNHQDELHNLVPLCKSCHECVHKDTLIIDGYEENSNDNRKLIYKWNYKNEIHEKSKKIKKKYDNETINIIKKYYNENTYKSKKDIIYNLKHNFNIVISNPILNKILNNSY